MGCLTIGTASNWHSSELSLYFRRLYKPHSSHSMRMTAQPSIHAKVDITENRSCRIAEVFFIGEVEELCRFQLCEVRTPFAEKNAMECTNFCKLKESGFQTLGLQAAWRERSVPDPHSFLHPIIAQFGVYTPAKTWSLAQNQECRFEPSCSCTL